MKERAEGGTADVATKLKCWNDTVKENKRMEISRHQINSYINNNKRKKAKEQADSSNAKLPARPIPMPPPPPPSPHPQRTALSRRSDPPRPEGLPDNYRRCAAGDRCCMNTNQNQWPGWADSQHKCPRCDKIGVVKHIHIFCCVETVMAKTPESDPKYFAVDGDINIAWSRTCFECAAANGSSSEPTTATESSVPIVTDGPTDSIHGESQPTPQGAPNAQPKKKVGRPKGSTNESKQQQEERTIEARNYVTEQYVFRWEEAKQAGKKQVPKGTLAELTAEARELFGIDDPNFSVPKQTISNRKQTGRHNVKHRGTPSPAAPIEETLKNIIIQAARMNYAMTKSEVIELANSLIKDTKYRGDILAFKAQRAHVESIADIEEPFGDAWYRGFMKRYKKELTRKRRKIFCTNRANGTKYEDYELMYDALDEVIVKSGNGEFYEEPVLMKLDGEVTEDETEAVGHPVRVKVTNPDNIIFFDEVGSNTNMKDDGHVGGEIFICEKGSNATILAATKDAHFTVIGITSGSGLPVMVAIIYKAKEVGPMWKHGFNVYASETDGVGEGKMFPGGPTVTFKGKEVPVYVNCSDSGSVISAILADMFKTMDDTGLFNRGSGQCPVAMVDGHCSRLGLPFLNYINAEETKWKVLLGVPNQTQYWQLGDSSEQNGCFKMALTKWKRSLIRMKKLNGGVPICIDNQEVAWGVNVACKDSFFRQEQNKRAMARRGLGITLNRGCLDIPEILATASLEYQAQRSEELAKQKNKLWSSKKMRNIVLSTTPELADLAKLNLGTGFSASFISLLCQEHKKQGGDKLHEERRKIAARGKKNLELIGKCTAGTIYTAAKAGEDISPVLDGKIHEFVRNREAAKESEKADKKKKSLRKRRATKVLVDKIRRTSKYKKLAKTQAWMNNDAKQLKKMLNTDARKSAYFFSNGDLKALVAWKKIKADGRMPTKKAQLVDLFLKTRLREEPILPPGDDGTGNDYDDEDGNVSDAEDDDDVGAESDGDGNGIDDDDDETAFQSDMSDEEEADFETENEEEASDGAMEFDDDPFSSAPTRKQPARRGVKRKSYVDDNSDSGEESDEDEMTTTPKRRGARGRTSAKQTN